MRLRDSVICLKTDTTFRGPSLRLCCIQGGHCGAWSSLIKRGHLKGHYRHLVTPGHSPTPHSHVVADRTGMCTNHHTLQPHPLWPTEKSSLPQPLPSVLLVYSVHPFPKEPPGPWGYSVADPISAVSNHPAFRKHLESFLFFLIHFSDIK